MATQAGTRTVRISVRRLNTMGAAYTDTFVGKRAQYVTDEGHTLVGIIEWERPAMYPTIRFEDGRWARLGHTITLVEDAAS
jgi:hypothetical protein